MILGYFNGVPADRIMFIGDRLLTDVLMANELGMISVHTQPLTEEKDNWAALHVCHEVMHWGYIL